jgi:hypothetical protein
MKKYVSRLLLAMMCYCSNQPPCLRTLSFPVVMSSLRLDFAILLDMNVVISLEDADFVIGKFDSGSQSASRKS